MLEDEGFEDGLGDLLLLGPEAGEGLELKPEILVRPALSLLEQQSICAHP